MGNLIQAMNFSSGNKRDVAVSARHFPLLEGGRLQPELTEIAPSLPIFHVRGTYSPELGVYLGKGYFHRALQHCGARCCRVHTHDMFRLGTSLIRNVQLLRGEIRNELSKTVLSSCVQNQTGYSHISITGLLLPWTLAGPLFVKDSNAQTACDGGWRDTEEMRDPR